MPQPSEASDPGRVTASVHAAFEAAWKRSRTPLDDWIRGVTAEFELSQRTRSPLGLNDAALITGATPAEVAAVLRLGSLDDESLSLLSKNPPPISTWLELGESPPELIRRGMKALDGRTRTEPAGRVLSQALGQTDGAARIARIRNLSGESLLAISRRAEGVDALRDRDRGFLAQVGRQFRRGQRTLSPPQVAYLVGVLETLEQVGTLTAHAGDPDFGACQEVRRALADPK